MNGRNYDSREVVMTSFHWAYNGHRHRGEQNSKEDNPDAGKGRMSKLLLGKICRKGKDSSNRITDYKIPLSAFGSIKPSIERA